jgi:hypothetical protein
MPIPSIRAGVPSPLHGWRDFMRSLLAYAGLSLHERRVAGVRKNERHALRLALTCDPAARGPLVGRCYRELAAAGLTPDRVVVVSEGRQSARVEACLGYRRDQWSALMAFVQRVGQLDGVRGVRWTVLKRS